MYAGHVWEVVEWIYAEHLDHVEKQGRVPGKREWEELKVCKAKPFP